MVSGHGHNIPDCGMAFATLAAAERLLVLGEPVGALLVVSYKQRQFMSHILTPERGFLFLMSQNQKNQHPPLVVLLSRRAVWQAATAVLPETLGHLLPESPFHVQSGQRKYNKQNFKGFLLSALLHSSLTANQLDWIKPLQSLLRYWDKFSGLAAHIM